MQIDFAVLSDYALIDQHGKLSVLGIFQHVWVAAFPAMHPRTHLVLRVRGRRIEVGSHPIRIRFVDDTGAELMGGEGTVQFGEEFVDVVSDGGFIPPGTRVQVIEVEGTRIVVKEV